MRWEKRAVSSKPELRLWWVQACIHSAAWRGKGVEWRWQRYKVAKGSEIILKSGFNSMWSRQRKDNPWRSSGACLKGWWQIWETLWGGLLQNLVDESKGAQNKEVINGSRCGCQAPRGRKGTQHFLRAAYCHTLCQPICICDLSLPTIVWNKYPRRNLQRRKLHSSFPQHIYLSNVLSTCWWIKQDMTSDLKELITK